MSRRLGRLLASPRLAALLLAVLIAMALLNVAVPQRTYLAPGQLADFQRSLPVLARLLSSLGLDAVFGGWPIAVVSALLLLNLVACTYRRVRARVATPRSSVSASAPRIPLTPTSVDDALDRVEAALSAEGWRTLSSTADGFVAGKAGHSFWGSVLLHVGIAVVIVGGALSVLGGFNGRIVLAEGQSVRDEASSYLSVDRLPQLGRAYTGAVVGLERMVVRYEGGDVVSAVAKMTATVAGGSVARDVRVNYPLEVGGKSYLLQENGYTVSLGVTPRGGEEHPVAVNLARSTPSGWADTLALEDGASGPIGLDMTATAEPVSDTGRTVPRKLEARDPRLVVAAKTADGRRWTGVLKPGQEAVLPDGTLLRFAGMRLWARFLVRGQPFRWLVYVGFWLGVAGAVWRFAFPELKVSVALTRDPEDAGLAVSWSARPWSPRGRSGEQALRSEIARATEEEREAG